MEEFVEVEPEALQEARTLPWKLLEIQRELKAPKNRHNEFGDYNSRSKEDILEAVKPLAHERGCYVICDDDVVLVADKWIYVKVKASLVDADTGESLSATAWAREPESKARMDSSQVTGSASSYAGKRALGNLFALDDTADSDQVNKGHDVPDGPFNASCTACGGAWMLTREQFESFVCPQCGNRHAKVV